EDLPPGGEEQPRQLQRPGDGPLGPRRLGASAGPIRRQHRLRLQHRRVLPEGDRAALLQPLPEGRGQPEAARGLRLRDGRQPLAGPLLADLRVSTSGTDSDWVVKLIDVFPASEEDPRRPALGQPQTRPYSGYQMMVRSEVLRGRFRKDPSRPEPFVSNQPT